MTNNTLSISQEQHQVLIGLILGDGHLELSENGKSARLKVEYARDKIEYVQHIYAIFKSWDLGPIREAIGEKKNNYAFSTKYSPSLLIYHQRFYDKDVKKHIPVFDTKGETDYTARSFAYHYMDDGGIKSKESKGVYLNTYCFAESEQEFLCEFLKNKFSLECHVTNDRGAPRIYISGKSYDKLVDLLNPYILPLFSYKVPPPRSPKSRFTTK